MDVVLQFEVHLKPRFGGVAKDLHRQGLQVVAFSVQGWDQFRCRVESRGHARVKACLAADMAIRKVATVCGGSKTTVQKIKAAIDKELEAA